MEETYISKPTECSNCGDDQKPQKIPKGLTVKEWLSHKECPNCGCRTLKEKDY
jgi:predicted RNA-binding Zn-ribbon protein involved in translation (DUF1610 family)